MDPTIKKIQHYIEENRLIETGDSLLLSISAGKDSMALVALLRSLQQEMDFTVALFHLNHMTRGIESDQDAEFVKKLAEELDLVLYTETFDFKTDKAKGMSFEEQAREVRYGLLRETCLRHGYMKIVTAHNFDDNIETIIMRFFSGTGIRGLQGIGVNLHGIIRPMLCLATEEIYGFLSRNNISWREDSSNATNVYKRNYLRNEIIPLIKNAFPMYAKSVKSLSDLVHEHVQYLDEVMLKPHETAIAHDGDITYINLEQLSDQFIIANLLARVLRERYSFITNRAIIREICRNLNSNSAHALLYQKNDLCIRKTWYNNKNYIKIDYVGTKTYKEEWQYTIQLNENESKKLFIPEISTTIGLQMMDIKDFNKNNTICNKKYIFVSITATVDSVIIRNRREGDKIRLNSGTKKIKKFFIEKKLDNEVKNCVPLLIINSTVAAIMSAFTSSIDNRVSNDYLITDNTKKILALYSE